MSLPGSHCADMITPMPTREVIEYTHAFAPESTAIETVYYNQNTARLVVRYLQGGGLYSYDHITLAMFRELSDAESAGKWMQKLRGSAGARHDQRAILEKVRVEDAQDESPFEALHATRLTQGTGEAYTLTFDYVIEGESTIEVRSTTFEDAITAFVEYFAEYPGIKVNLKKVEVGDAG